MLVKIISNSSQSREIELDIPSGINVQELKKFLYKRSGIPVDEMRLISHGKLLTNSIDVDSLDSSSMVLYRTINAQKNFKITVKLPAAIQQSSPIIGQFSVSADEKIERLRNLVWELTKSKLEINLVYNSILLENHRTFLDYSILKDSIIFVVPKSTQVEFRLPNGSTGQVSINDSENAPMYEQLLENLSLKDDNSISTTEMKKSTPESQRITPAKRKSSEREDASSATVGAETPHEYVGLKKGFLNSASSKKNNETKKSKTTSSISSIPPIVPQKNTTDQNIVVSIPVTTTLSSSVVPADNQTSVKCGVCSKKLPLTAIQCKCGAHFCAAHRYPEEHKCVVNYRQLQREVLTKQNERIVAPKVMNAL